MKGCFYLIACCFVFAVFPFIAVSANTSDTVIVQPKNIHTQWLQDGTARYLVYGKASGNGLRQYVQFWSRTTRRIEYEGQKAIEIIQEWEDKDSLLHIVRSICDAVTMRPLHHRYWWRAIQIRPAVIRPSRSATVDFLKKTVSLNEKMLSAADTDRLEKAVFKAFVSAEDKFSLNWHLDLETFSLLEYKENRCFVIPFYDPGTDYGFEKVLYTVTGTGVLHGVDGQTIDCWLLEHQEVGDHEIFWVSKKTHELLKLEEKVGTGSYRYKIRLGFSE